MGMMDEEKASILKMEQEEETVKKYVFEEPEEHPDPLPRDQTQIDSMILKPKGSSRQIYIPEPIFEELEVAEILTDENGNPIMLNGLPAVKTKKMQVFKSFVQRALKIPIPELYTTDLTASNLDPVDIALIRNIDNDIGFLVARMIKENKNYSGYIHRLYLTRMAIVNTAKARDGATAMLTHSSFSKKEEIGMLTRREFQREQKKKGLLAKVLNR